MKHFTTHLIGRLAKKHRRPAEHYRVAIAQIVEEIAQELSEGHQLQLTQFGTFYTRLQPAQVIQKDFRTGKARSVPAHRRAAFRPGELLKRAAHTPRHPIGRLRKAVRRLRKAA